MGMDFVDPEELPQPPELVRFQNIFVQSYPDGRRVKVRIEVMAFQEPPDIEIEVLNQGGDRVASASIIEMGSRNLELTLHLRGDSHPGRYVCRFELSYRDRKLVDSQEVAFSVFEADNHDQE